MKAGEFLPAQSAFSSLLPSGLPLPSRTHLGSTSSIPDCPSSWRSFLGPNAIALVISIVPLEQYLDQMIIMTRL